MCSQDDCIGRLRTRLCSCAVEVEGVVELASDSCARAHVGSAGAAAGWSAPQSMLSDKSRLAYVCSCCFQL